jgi:hypothetical protein
MSKSKSQWDFGELFPFQLEIFRRCLNLCAC